jgi:NAD(P)-dependent dehydrogenase (short-subunit alcohol dehydrogenase family)
MMTRVCAVVGVGPGNGAAIARRFAVEGYAIALLARTSACTQALAQELGRARAYACDVSDPAAVERAFASIKHDLGEVDVLVYNAGSGTWGSVDEVDVPAFENAWRINALGAFVASRQVIPGMRRRGAGVIVFIGATASRRGAPRTAAFAPAKAAQRSLAESMAKSLGPQGVHVAVLIIDGVVDLPRTRAAMPDKPDGFFVAPDAVAELVAHLAHQPRSAWSFEVDARPFAETW